ncbi:hypothetical protein BD413DRAFT_619673 [Trametes elegans]|nr:hypothetical protein BD413DRAFT_619673 [Trametes elegans]
MATRQRSASTSRKYVQGLWRTNDSDSDRPRQTMATTQRHNVDQSLPADGSRKHRSSRRADPLDPAASSHHHHHKSSSKDRTSIAQQPSYSAAPQQSQSSSQHRTQDAYGDAYGLRAYIKKRTDKRSPKSSNEKVSPGDDPQGSRSANPSRYDYATAATYAQPPAAANYYNNPPDQTTRDPTSSSRHHRERDKDREKSRKHDVDKSGTREYRAETSEERERRRRKEKEARKEKERSSKDRERRKERDRSRDPTSDRRALDSASLHLPQASPANQRPVERQPAAYLDHGYTQTEQATTVPSATAAPWAGLTAAGRTATIPVTIPAAESGYRSASDREDPPLPIPPPGHRRERSSSKPHRSQRHHVLAQQAAQDSGISSSEQEHSGMDRSKPSERRYISREQASTLGRGYSSGPSGSENEKLPTVTKERRKHKESSRHKTKAASVDVQQPSGPTTSQEIATAWYQRHQRDAAAMKPTAPSGNSPQRPPITVPTSGKPTPYVGLTTSQRPAPQIVSIRAGQGPSEPHPGTLLPKNQNATLATRLGETQPVDRTQDPTSRAQASGQYYQQSATLLGQAPHQPAVHQGAMNGHQQSAQGYPNTASHARHADSNGVHSTAVYGSLPDVVVRPPSAAPTHQDPQSTGRLQIPSHESRSPTAYTHGHTQQAPSYSHAPTSGQHLDANTHHSMQAATAQPHDADLHRMASPAPHGHSHARAAPHDLSSRFPSTNSAAPMGYGSQQAGTAYNPPAQTTRPGATASQGQPSESPKRNLTFPGASAPPPATSVHVNPSNYYGAAGVDPRSPKPPRGHHSTHTQASRYEQLSAQHLADPGRSPAIVGHAHSPSTRLHSHRNGMSHQQLPHHTNATNPHINATSRPDNASVSRQPIASYLPNGTSTGHSQSYSTQTPMTSYDQQQYGRTTATTAQTTYASQQPTSQGHARGAQAADYGQRPPPRTAPSPAPTVRPLRLNAVSSPSGKNGSAATTVYPPAHIRTISDPQYPGKMGNTAYPSGSLPSRALPQSRPTAAATLQSPDVLLTPSSLAPSMLPQVSPTVPLGRTTSKTSTTKEKEKEKKKGFFGLFRSRSSPPKPREVEPLPAATVKQLRERSASQNTQTATYTQPPNVAVDSSVAVKPTPGAPAPQVATVAAVSIPAQSQPQPQHGRVPHQPHIASPTPVPASGGRGTNGKMFTPFRLLSKRHRTVSTASVDAVDGTVINAMLTGGDSTRSSTAGRPSPPLRDPMTAAQEWRNREEYEQQGRGTVRRRRPGVTFDVGEEVPENGRLPVQKSMRANVAAMHMEVTPVPAPTRQATA